MDSIEQEAKPIMVYVDDATNNRLFFEQVFGEEWDFRAFSNASEALRALPDLDPWIIVSDNNMPGSTGIEFLEKAAELLPDAVRILITGFSDEQIVIDAIQKAHVYDYLRKPMSIEEMQTRITMANDHFKKGRDTRIKYELLQKENRKLQKVIEQLKADSEPK